jgi:hypothetical protein
MNNLTQELMGRCSLREKDRTLESQMEQWGRIQWRSIHQLFKLKSVWSNKQSKEIMDNFMNMELMKKHICVREILWLQGMDETAYPNWKFNLVQRRYRVAKRWWPYWR